MLSYRWKMKNLINNKWIKVKVINNVQYTHFIPFELFQHFPTLELIYSINISLTLYQLKCTSWEKLKHPFYAFAFYFITYLANSKAFIIHFLPSKMLLYIEEIKWSMTSVNFNHKTFYDDRVYDIFYSCGKFMK